eukprot:symbB.v1.2.005550.t1/scaffold258.1/size251559/4
MSLRRLWHGQDVPDANDNVPANAAGDDSSASSSDPDSPINESESESSSNKDELAELQAVVKRRQQTEKARLNSIKARTLRKHAKHVDMKTCEHPAESFRKDITPDSDINRPGTVNIRFRRLRLLFSWFKAWGRAVVSFFNEKSDKINHCILVSVVDDTNMRLSEIPDGAPQWRMARTVNVMNNVQNLVVNYDLEDAHDPCHKHFAIHTPLACLAKSDRDGISSEFASRLFCFLGRVSQRYRSWNVASDLMSNEGCSLHAILPRALARLSETNFKNNPDKKVDEILTALQEADLQETSEDQMDLAGLLAQIQHGEEASFAQVNQKRRVLTFEAFRDKDLTSKTAAVESLMKPNVHQMDILFERTQCIADLSKSADIFKSFMFGQLGERCIAEYVDILQKFPQLGIEELAPQYFSLSLQAMGEHWRRLCFPTGSFPYVIFKLVEMDDAAFLREYLRLQQLMTDCHNCVDLEFSAVLLSVIPPQSDLESQGVLLQIGRLRRFLYDLCIWAPLSSDIVECYHGFTQCQLHRWRGSKVTDPVAQERTVWYSICSAYGMFKKWMHAQFLDKWFWMRLACWNVFQRDFMKDLQLSPDQWGARLQQCKDAWRVLPEAERALYTAKAAEEEGLRNEASIQPLPPKSQSSQAQADHLPAAFDAASELGRNALKKLSKHRVFASYKKLKESDLWTSHGTGLASFDGALSLDLIDLRATEDEIFETWQEFASSKRLNTNWVKLPDAEVLTGISFVIHNFEIHPFSPLVEVKTTSVAGPRPLLVERPKPVQKKRKLPFGLKPAVRKWRRRQNDQQKAAAQPKRRNQKQDEQPAAQAAGSGHGPDCADDDPENTNVPNDDDEFDIGVEDHSSDSTCSKHDDDISSDGSSSSSDSETNIAAPVLAEQPLLSAEASQEIAVVNKIFDAHSRQVEDSGQVFCPRGVEPEAASSSAALPKGSFCNASLGVSGVSFQMASKLARCRHCVEPIQKGVFRVSYAWSYKKFHSYLHGGCTLPHLKQEGASMQQALEFFQRQLASENLSEKMRGEIEKVNNELVAEES